MIAVALITIIMYLIWGIISRQEQVPENTKGWMKPFYRMALLLYKKMCIYKKRDYASLQVRKDLERLHPGVNLTVMMTDYYVKKLALMLVVLLAGTGIGVVVRVQAKGKEMLQEGGLITRGDYEQEEATLVLEAIMAKKPKRFEIIVHQKELTRVEADKLQEEFWQLLFIQLLNGNGSADSVTGNLNCVQEIHGYPFVVEWSSSHPDIVSRNGEIQEQPLEPGIQVTFKAVITYGEWEWIHEVPLKIYGPERTEDEQLYDKLEQELIDAEASSRQSESWQLPQRIEGREVIWREKVENNSLLFWGMMVTVSFAIYFLSDQDLHEKLEEKNKRLKAEYPLIVNKMTLYLGAGMTVRGAFRKIAENYQQNLKEGGKPHPAYEEMVYTCRELSDGIAEGAAYEHFGKRAGLQEYIRFSTLLTQNLKKGNSALLPRLQEEAEKMLAEQMNLFKQSGEEAGTKMLVPMIMLLGIVMVLIMIPAFTSFGI